MNVSLFFYKLLSRPVYYNKHMLVIDMKKDFWLLVDE